MSISAPPIPRPTSPPTLDGQLETYDQPHRPRGRDEAYVDRVMATRGAHLDEAGRALLAEDLRSPCYEEVAVFAAFSRIVSQARSSFVVLDTAPTGHTLLLLDATGAYHRQMAERLAAHVGSPRHAADEAARSEVHEDPIVALPETTPVSEAARLQADLQRAHIEPYGWVINSSFAAAGATDPCLDSASLPSSNRSRWYARSTLEEVAIVPWMSEEPVGPTRLLALARGAKEAP